MARKLLFVDRDGTLVREPHDYQIDDLSKISFLPGVIHAMKSLVDMGYEPVMVTNQDGLGGEGYPLDKFQVAMDKILEIFEGEGVKFLKVCVDEHFPEDNHPNRKPNTGMVTELITSDDFDLANSYMVGDRSTDAMFARNVGCRSITIKDPDSADGEAKVKIKSDEPIATTHVTSWAELVEHVRKEQAATAA